MKYWVIAVFCFFIYSCKTLGVASGKNARNTTSLGIEWSYSDKFNDQLHSKVDAAISNVMDKFNSEHHSFSAHKKTKKDKDYLSISFDRGKIVSQGGKIAGYTISALGLIATPAIMIAANTGFILLFYYFPTHKIDSRFSLSPYLADGNARPRHLLTETGAMFARTRPKVDKLVKKFSDRLYNILIEIDTKVSSH